MKLYTEEQVKQSFFEGIKYAAIIAPASMGEQDKYVQNTIDSLTPIELPSDEEIIYRCFQEDSYELGTDGDSALKVYSDGYKAALEQILNQNK